MSVLSHQGARAALQYQTPTLDIYTGLWQALFLEMEKMTTLSTNLNYLLSRPCFMTLKLILFITWVNSSLR